MTDAELAQRREAGLKPGANSHDGTVFRRGRDHIPRGSMRLMARVVQLDQREAIYEGLVHLTTTAKKNPKVFLKAVEFLADRTEGKPTQHIVADHRRSTTFVLDGQAQPVSEGEAQAAVPPESTPGPVADLAQLPPGLSVEPREPLA